MDDTTECARDLVIAVFRLAVSDSLGLAYGHDAPARTLTIVSRTSSEARAFLDSPWADHLADISGFSADSVRQELARRSGARRSDRSHQHVRCRPVERGALGGRESRGGSELLLNDPLISPGT